MLKVSIYCNQYFRIDVYRRKLKGRLKEYGYQEKFRWDTGEKFQPKGEIIWGFNNYQKLEKFIYDKYKNDPNIYKQYEVQ